MSVIVDNGSGEVTVEIPESLPTATMLNQNTDTYNDYLGIKPPFGMPASVMPGEVPYTSQLPYLVHPAMKTHPSFVPPTDGSMIQGASPLYANFVPPTQVGGYAGTNQGYCGNTYLPDQQAPISNASAVGGGSLVNSTAAWQSKMSMLGMSGGGMDPLGNLVGTQLSEIQKLRLLQARSMTNNVFSLAPNDQNFVQASGSQQLVFPYGSNAIPRPSAMSPQNNWIHAQQSDRTPHLSQPLGMPPGTMSYSNPTTMVNVYTVPSAFALDPYFGGTPNIYQ